MRYHIVNGDALREKFPFETMAGDVIVIREAFIDGPVSNHYDASFWTTRKKYIHNAYGESEEFYTDRVMSELTRLHEITAEDDVYLWFEDDLFCQCNMWFAVDYILQHSRPKFFRIFPEADEVSWKGFGFAETEDLLQYFNQAMALPDQDAGHIHKLWKAYVEKDEQTLKRLGDNHCSGIRFQKAVIRAQAERTPDESGRGRPQQTLSTLLKEGHQSFYKLYEKFSQREGIYGFGDAQVRNMLKDMNSNHQPE